MLARSWESQISLSVHPSVFPGLVTLLKSTCTTTLQNISCLSTQGIEIFVLIHRCACSVQEPVENRQSANVLANGRPKNATIELPYRVETGPLMYTKSNRKSGFASLFAWFPQTAIYLLPVLALAASGCDFSPFSAHDDFIERIVVLLP